MNCPHCNEAISANARFCGRCGQLLEAVPALAAAWSRFPDSAPGLLSRIKNILLSPAGEWPVIAAQFTAIPQLFVSYVTPLAVLVAVMSFLRISVLGVSSAFGNRFRLPIGSGLLYTALAFACTLIGVFVVGLIINALAPSFSGRKDQRQAMKVSAYSLTPAMVSAVLSLSPVLPTLLQCLMGLFGIYVLYLGLPVVMQSPKEEAFGYTASVVICTVLFGIVLGVLNAMAHIGAGAHAALVGSSPAERVAEHDAARQQGAATVANAIGGLLGTDEKGKAGLNTALSNLAKAGDAQPQQPTTPAAAAGVLTALGGALGGDHPVQAVDFKSLTVSLPASLPGMTRTSAVGESQGALGVKASSAKADYRAGDGVRSVHVEIADVSGISGLMDLAGGLVQNATSESDSGYEKDVALDGRSVHEKFDARSHAGELSTLIAKRYAVDVSGAGVDMEVLEQTLSQIDLARLDSMKDAGAPATH